MSQQVIEELSGEELKKQLADRLDRVNGLLFQGGLIPELGNQNTPEAKKEMILTFSAVIILGVMMREYMAKNGMAIVSAELVPERGSPDAFMAPGPPPGVMM